MTGERDGGKTGLSEEMLNMHGCLTNEQDADSIYSVSVGSANTEAKFGKAISKTTYAIEFSEFGKVEAYGRHEDLVECYKTCIDALIVRRGKKDNRNDAPFPSLSPLVINGNSIFIHSKVNCSNIIILPSSQKRTDMIEVVAVLSIHSSERINIIEKH
jgi:hypothetical protein